MPDIRPISDLRNHFKDIERAVQQTGGPIFFTQKGRASFVLLSNDKYDELMAMLEDCRRQGRERPMSADSAASGVRF